MRWMPRLLEDINENDAAALYSAACELYEGADKDHYAVQTLRSSFAFMLSTKRCVPAQTSLPGSLCLLFSSHKRAVTLMFSWAAAIKLVDSLIAMFGRLKQEHNIHQMLLSKIVLILYGGDLESAKRLFNSSVGCVFSSCY
jgi:hypothetical protein